MILDLIALGVIIWFIIAVIGGTFVGRCSQNVDDGQPGRRPSPNHPAGRAPKTLHHTDGRPLDEWEQRKFNQIIQGDQGNVTPPGTSSL